ncbi:hypothetical protein D0864_14313 [Hortaea werneckii]|uniref:DUF7703 domain-containing protein n=1 Tax=Hortaea werneckii TaxID=91943 RepID=A0A3M7CKF0_HORWE|nr:hypothetical protein D0864_14313 [Hortaea werneckii]
MAEGDRFVASIGPLNNVTLVVVGVSFTAVAWHNGLEIILTTLVTFTKYGTYFYSLIVAALGILCFQSAVFCMIFAPGSNGYGVIAAVDVGWICMVTGQSMVLWSRLHLICHSHWKLRGILVMIVTNAIVFHGSQTVCSLLAVQNQAINPEYLPFIYAEKISLCFFFAQEVTISGLYIWETAKHLRLASTVRTGSKYRRMRNLLLANVAILALDICLISLEFASLWGVWCTFKGFAYSSKLKIEFAILNQLRDTFTQGMRTSHAGTDGTYRSPSSKDQSRASHPDAAREYDRVALTRLGTQTECDQASVRDSNFTDVGNSEGIVKTVNYTVSHQDPGRGEKLEQRSICERPPSPSSSEMRFASKGV